ncbi:cupin domain-containing protein [Novosphingobium mangrovi (ex Hu et al. 2023)]|uniref:Cupin domain-containing protein n=1 Tax=Novosphingobium mangrovi (ex Hu et al. 2023) TaxID=2930094 RepID=A0ABT0A7Y3_9SPHN|nr:cupin domain-containing protein [Novosphingobium mangrovi (ex Hu et al. 2023)]MCJ1959303.1 cupin domain-containing protein [Novosphingobium mangrovi (ex Hu et al. 2023)]
MSKFALAAALAGAGLACSASALSAQDKGQEADQVVVDQNETEAQEGPADYFTGTAYIRRLTSATAPGQAGTALVTFTPGARSNWHTHPAGQTLYVTGGCGWTQAEGQDPQRICTGDMVYVKPNVRHWHGATSAETMTHVAITESLNGKGVNWQEPVTDAQYTGPAN